MAAIFNVFKSSPKTPDSGAEESNAPSSAPPLPQNAISAYFANLAEGIVNIPPYLGKGRVWQVCKFRDKEGLLGEIIDLKDALDKTEIHLSEHRHEYLRRLAENRKLERRVEELEQRGNFDAPRSGGVCRLEAREKGLVTQLSLLSDTIAARKHGELYELSRDLCATKTRETEVQRDTYAAEIGRLRMVLNHLKMLYAQAQEENNDYLMCQRRANKLEETNPKLQKTVENLKASVKKASEDIKSSKIKGDEAVLDVKVWTGKYKSAESQIVSLNATVKSAEAMKKKKLRKLHQVGFDRMNFNKQFRAANPLF